MLENIRGYIKKQNQNGHYLWLRNLWRSLRDFLRDVSQPYLIRRIVSFWHFVFLIYVKKWPRLKIDKKIINSVFYICLNKRDKQTWVVKIPRLNNDVGCDFYKKILSQEDFIKYSDMIKSVFVDPIIGKHFPPVRDVKRNGGYSSLYVEGYNLITLQEDLLLGRGLPCDINHPDLIDAVNELLDSLRHFEKQNGRICGDWALHNLLYDKLARKIKNVDLEGFYMYRQDQLGAASRYIEEVLRLLMNSRATAVSDAT